MARLYAGATIKIEATIQRAVPFGDDSLYNPANGVNITINYANAAVVSSTAMTNSDTGKYYYYYQSIEGNAGRYEYEIVADGSDYDGFIHGTFELF